MRRLVTAAALAVALCAVAVVPAASATRVVGGPRGASMAFSFTATGPQQHFLAETTDTSVDHEVEEECVQPRCYAFPFVVAAPAKGVKSVPVSAQITWTSPAARFWLLLVDVTKAPEIVGECFSFFTSTGPSATIESSRLKIGRKYAVWVTVEQVVGTSEVVKGVVHSPAKDKAKGSPLAAADKTGLFLPPCEG